ncbi:MAG: hypothetical protein IPL13_18820 [Saprospiraceae bacterium]|uniref:hypothetical protein n=1 Tax=Candidatus Brachybacter algidus TaxID=2982024 RepID=UPI001B53A737|nr:hypothetical protein [Candidatus Brachybacter algidus]MBP7541345.1 hypothetical protein [Saprospiraceae bacterium]MBK8357352.1 hypothetical protein [Candidatus Brachybacter algidus]MBK8843523.1 hypothetical protein [Candidatus Brachybacter algidus]MBL0121124.1 hypothetical protein [Candidatus Brachybacter algidus]MBP8893756.1 hypothetical protein [Saprospiraceae bacterium]
MSPNEEKEVLSACREIGLIGGALFCRKLITYFVSCKSVDISKSTFRRFAMGGLSSTNVY